MPGHYKSRSELESEFDCWPLAGCQGTRRRRAGRLAPERHWQPLGSDTATGTGIASGTALAVPA